MIEPGGDVLVMAGDIVEARMLRKYAPDHLGILEGQQVSNKESYNQFFDRLSGMFKHVIVVPGNHEHYHRTFDTTVGHMRMNLPDNFHVLDNSVFELDDVLFVGGTLWTDCNKRDPLSMMVVENGLADYTTVKKCVNGNWRRLKTEDTIAEFKKTVRYLEIILANPLNLDKKIVVVTHHAPSMLSIAEQYRGSVQMNGGFASDLSDFILDHPQIKIWMHGHTHTKFDYMIGETRIVCNPRGYHTRKGVEYTGWDPNWIITL